MSTCTRWLRHSGNKRKHVYICTPHLISCSNQYQGPDLKQLGVSIKLIDYSLNLHPENTLIYSPIPPPPMPILHTHVCLLSQIDIESAVTLSPEKSRMARAFTTWQSWWRSTLNTGDYLKFVSREVSQCVSTCAR